jgi:hypothetical protein
MEMNPSRHVILSLLWLRNSPLYPLLIIVAAAVACYRILTGVTSVQQTLSQATREQFLGTFAKLRKATISFFMSVCLSVRMEQLGSQLMDSHEI